MSSEQNAGIRDPAVQAAHTATSSTGSPEDDLLSDPEAKLLQLWKGILDLTDISPDDDFFLCGGNSLAAIELLIKIKREFQVSLPPETIYRYPTIRQQAAFLMERSHRKTAYHTLIIPLREGGSRPPLFCIHPLGGWMDHYLRILSAVNSDRPVFGIRGRGLEPGEALPTTVEATAKEQVEAIMTVQKTGPYHLLGFSNGGIIAFELACQLQEKGEQTGFLGIIDVSAPATEVRYIKTLAASLFPGRFLGKIPAFFEYHLKAHPDSRIYKWTMKIIQEFFHSVLFRSPAKSLPESVSDFHASVHTPDTSLARYPEASHPNMKVQLNASRMYLPHKFTGGIVLYSTGPDPVLFPGDVTRGWGSKITGKCEVIAVPGDHSNLFDEPQIGILIDKLRGSLRVHE